MKAQQKIGLRHCPQNFFFIILYYVKYEKMILPFYDKLFLFYNLQPTWANLINLFVLYSQRARSAAPQITLWRAKTREKKKFDY